MNRQGRLNPDFIVQPDQWQNNGDWLYDEQYGPPDPHKHPLYYDEWYDPVGDAAATIVGAQQQLAINVARWKKRNGSHKVDKPNTGKSFQRVAKPDAPYESMVENPFSPIGVGNCICRPQLEPTFGGWWVMSNCPIHGKRGPYHGSKLERAADGRGRRSRKASR